MALDHACLPASARPQGAVCEIRTRDVLAENEVASATGPTRHGALDGNPTHHDPLDRQATSAAVSEGKEEEVRQRGIEPRFQPWQGRRLPLSHYRGVPEG